MELKLHPPKSRLRAASVTPALTSSPAPGAWAGSGPLGGKFMVTFGINKGNWESLARAKLSRHLSKTVKRRSPAACVDAGGPPRSPPTEPGGKQRAWISLPKLQDAGFSECRQQTHIHLSKAVNQCFNRSCQTLIYLFTYLFC